MEGIFLFNLHTWWRDIIKEATLEDTPIIIVQIKFNMQMDKKKLISRLF